MTNMHKLMPRTGSEITYPVCFWFSSGGRNTQRKSSKVSKTYREKPSTYSAARSIALAPKPQTWGIAVPHPKQPASQINGFTQGLICLNMLVFYSD